MLSLPAQVQSLVEDLKCCKLCGQRAGQLAHRVSACIHEHSREHLYDLHARYHVGTTMGAEHLRWRYFTVGLCTIRAVLGWRCLKISEKTCFGIFWGRARERGRMDVHDGGWMRGGQRRSWRTSIKPSGAVMSWATWTCWASIPSGT